MLPTLFAFGSNGSGQLGIGHDEDVNVPTRCIFESKDFSSPSQSNTTSDGAPEKKSTATVTRIAAGGNHTLILLDDGRVYSAGWGSFVFKRVFVTDADSGKVIGGFRDVAATWEGSILVATGPDQEPEPNPQAGGKDIVFVLGSGSKGELGLGSEITSTAETSVKIPDFLPDGVSVDIVSVAAGMSHVVTVCSDGSVYGWGASRKGQLGQALLSEKVVWEPRRFETPFKVKNAVCGREFTVLCGDATKGEFVVLGPWDAKSLNMNGGNGNGSKYIDKWGIRSGIPTSEEVKGYLDIHTSWHGIYIHQQSHSIHAWGRNDRGQIPPLNGTERVKTFAPGSEHGLALFDNGNVVAFGWGEHGNCGAETDEKGDVKGTVSTIALPEIDEGSALEVAGVGAGCATSWIVASESAT